MRTSKIKYEVKILPKDHGNQSMDDIPWRECSYLPEIEDGFLHMPVYAKGELPNIVCVNLDEISCYQYRAVYE
jgi:hypothetical protein